MRIHSFPPVTDKKTKILILGSMPGAKSLADDQYYANPLNQFWSIIAEITDKDLPNTYNSKLKMLKRFNIGVWDVIKSCERIGSSDSKIRNIKTHDFSNFFEEHPALHTVIFNGKKAEAVYKQFKLPLPDNIDFVCAPSTSPLNTISRAGKLNTWAKLIK